MEYTGIIALILLIIALVIFLKKYPEHEEEDEDEDNEVVEEASNEATRNPLDENDEDAMAACLVAAIEERQQSGKNVHILSVREVK